MKSKRNKFMNCSNAHNQLSAYLDHELADDKARKVAKHLENCDICRKEFKTLQNINSILNGLQELTVSESFRRKLEKNLTRQQHWVKRNVPFRHPLFFIKTIIESILLSILKKPSGQNSILEEFYDLPPNSMGRIYFKLL
jgi:hypothetical protein